MNVGERDELIFKIYMTQIRDREESLLGEALKSVGFDRIEYGSLPNGIDMNAVLGMNAFELNRLAASMGILKAPTGAKADVYIDGAGYSLKSMAAAPAALVNHTARPGFEFACLNANTSIDTLDNIVDDYWNKRMDGIITEDTRISDFNCPFKGYKEYMRPILEYFLFEGTGGKRSAFPADYIIEFGNPVDESTYRLLTREDAVNDVWPKLIFSLRAKKGMPKNYNPNTFFGKNAESIARWVKYHSGDYRGALHIRASK